MSISTQTNDAQVALDHIHKSTATTIMLPSVGHSIIVQEDDDHDEDAIVEEITKPNTQARIHDWIYLIYRTYYTYCYWLLSVNCLCLNSRFVSLNSITYLLDLTCILYISSLSTSTFTTDIA
jgi:hypothetical protein